MTSNIREATSVDEVLPLVKEHIEYFNLPIDILKTIRTLQHMIDNPAAKVFVSLDKEGKVQGYLCAIITEHFFMPGKTATELGLYSKSSGHGRELIKAYETWVKDSGVKIATLMSLSHRPDKYYKRLGYNLFETSYIKVL